MKKIIEHDHPTAEYDVCNAKKSTDETSLL